MVTRLNTVGAIDQSITIDPLRECRADVRLDGPQGLLSQLSEQHRIAFEQAVAFGDVGYCDSTTWNAFAEALRAAHPTLGPLIDWLTTQAEGSRLGSATPEDRSWQEQQDAFRTALRMADFPLSVGNAWQRPDSPHAPYLAGLIPEPVENSMIEHDANAMAGLFDAWEERSEFRCDIHVSCDSNGRRLEMANINATPVEHRLGADLIFYHEATHSFVLVQYKRLDAHTKSIYADDRLHSQMRRLEKVAALSGAAKKPSDWRLGTDSCFLKLAYWPNNHHVSREPAPGMYLPLSYVRLLLADECTEGPDGGCILGYETIARYLIDTQFTELVKNGLAGTVGTSVEQLRELGTKRAEECSSVFVAAERSSETPKQRQQRVRVRGPRKER